MGTEGGSYEDREEPKRGASEETHAVNNLCDNQFVPFELPSLQPLSWRLKLMQTGSRGPRVSQRHQENQACGEPEEP